MLSQEKSGRIEYFDILKGIGIVLVVWGHCIQYGNGSSFYESRGYFDDILFRFIYSFHMPFFMFVSGYLFFFSARKHQARSLALSRFRGLIVPALTFSAIALATRCDWVEAPPSFSAVVRYVLVQLWFLWSVFFSSMAVLIVHRWFNDKFMVHAALMVLAFLTPDPLYFSYYKWTYFYFVAGYYMSCHVVSLQRYSAYSRAVLAATTLLFVLMLQFYDSNIFIYNTGMTILSRASSPLAVCHQLYYDVFRIVTGFLGTFAVALLVWSARSFLEKRPAATRWLVVMGRNTLGIYFFQSFITDGGILARFTGELNYSIIAPIGEVVVIIPVCLLCVWVAKRFRATRLLILGMKQ